MGEGGMDRPLRLRKGTRTSEAMFAGDARGGARHAHPPNPLTLNEGGICLLWIPACAGMTVGRGGRFRPNSHFAVSSSTLATEPCKTERLNPKWQTDHSHP